MSVYYKSENLNGLKQLIMVMTIDARFVNFSGIGVYTQNLLSNQLLNNYKLRILYNKKDIQYFDKLTDKADMMEYDAELYSIKDVLVTPAKTLHTDIFWSPHYNVPYFNFASKLKIVTIHDVLHRVEYHSLGIKQRVYLDLIQTRAIKNSDIIFTDSEFSKSEILKYYKCNPEKISVVYLGIDREKFQIPYSNNQKEVLFSKCNITGPYILFVGNVKPHKNLKTALSGFKEFVQNSSDFNNFNFLIVGKKDGFINTDSEIEKLLMEPFFKDRLKFTGWVTDNDLAIVYQEASLFIFPSLYEGFGLPPLEAMAAGIPVINSNIPCVKEVCGDAALYFDPLDKGSIAETIYKVLSEPLMKQNLIAKGKSQVLKYNWDDTFKKKFKLIESLI